MKKLFALLLALTMVFSLAATAAAAEADLTGHTYKAYKIFAGTQTDDANDITLAISGWGDGVNGVNLLTALKDSPSFGEPNPFASCETAKDVADVLGGFSDNSENAEAFAKLAYANKTGDGVDAGGTLDAGYYLVVDVTELNAGATNTVKNLALLQMTKKDTFEIRNKTDVPEVQKKVKDINDSVASSDTNPSDWPDSADHDIGDAVPFQLKATLPSDLDNYTTYYMVFHDKQSAGLTFNKNSVEVFVDGTKITSGYEVVTEGLNDGCTFEVRFTDVKDESVGAKASGNITVEYTATLNENAVIGSAGNPNEVYLQYSNNPNVGGSGETGKTPPDKVIVFTYKLVVNKTDSTGKPLTGAEFKLEKKQQDGTWKEITLTKSASGEGETAVANSVFSAEGLDDGTYRITETAAPAGYNSIDPIEFTVTAEHDILADNPTLISLTGTAASGEITFTADKTAGSLSTDIINNKGTQLPETGGMGTTLFYIVGGIMVAAAVVLLVTKKRMGAET